MSRVSISYFPEGHSKEIAGEIISALSRHEVDVYGIKKLNYLADLNEHRNLLAESECIVLVVCDAYLKSSECLLELLLIYKKGSFKERVLPVLLEDAKIHDPLHHLNYIKELESKIIEIDEAIRQLDKLSYIDGISEYLNNQESTRRYQSKIFNTFKSLHIPRLDALKKNNYEIIVEAVLERHKKLNSQELSCSSKAKKTTTKPTMEKVFLCNRKNQNNTFHSLREESKKIHAFYIHGDELHGHNEMFQRFCNELSGHYLTNKKNRKKIKSFRIGFAGIAPSNFREALLIKLFTDFGVNLNDAAPIEKRDIGYIYTEGNSVKKMKTGDVVAVRFNISGGEWFPSMMKDIEWFINDFCSVSSLRDNDAPQFYFFFSMVYSKANYSNVDLVRHPIKFFRKVQKKSTIVKAIQQTIIPEIDELSWVKEEDIEEWLINIGITPDKRQSLIKEDFRKLRDSHKGYYMSTLKSKLLKVIETYNKNITS